MLRKPYHFYPSAASPPPATFAFEGLRQRDSGLERDLAIAQRLADWLDTKFKVAGVRFGLDAILGLLPGIGDTLTSLASLYILGLATRHHVPRVTQARMAANIAVDWLVGCIPIIGDAFDVAWKSNQMNVALLRRHFSSSSEEQRRHRRRDWLFLGLLIFGLLTVLAGSIFIAYFMVQKVWNLMS